MASRSRVVDELLTTLGLGDQLDRITSVSLNMKAGELVTLNVEMIVASEELQRFIRVVDQYEVHVPSV